MRKTHLTNRFKGKISTILGIGLVLLGWCDILIDGIMLQSKLLISAGSLTGILGVMLVIRGAKYVKMNYQNNRSIKSNGQSTTTKRR